MTQVTSSKFLGEDDRDFLSAVTAADGIPPLSDGVLQAVTDDRGEQSPASAEDADVQNTDGEDADLQDTGRQDTDVQDTDGEARVLRLNDGAELVGLGVLTPLGTRSAAEFCIAPARRGQGLGRRLFEALAAAASAPTWYWSHGDFPAAARIAEAAGLSRDRELLQMITGADLDAASLPAPAPPEGVILRDFTPADAEAWVRVNNAAFDWHPEQGGQTLDDVTEIVSADDFDPASVIIAERDGQVIGFHHTKMHPAAAGGRNIGEVYVIGVDPQAHSGGVGKALTLAGLQYLFAAGAEAVELYVEADNVPARRLYEKLGFEVRVVHVAYAPAEAVQTTAESAPAPEES